MYIHTYILCTIYIVHMYNMYKNVYIYICVCIFPRYFHATSAPQEVGYLSSPCITENRLATELKILQSYDTSEVTSDSRRKTTWMPLERSPILYLLIVFTLLKQTISIRMVAAGVHSAWYLETVPVLMSSYSSSKDPVKNYCICHLVDTRNSNL